MEKKALYNLSYGVFMLSTRSGEKVNGCITNTCMQVANDPVRIAISVLNSNYTCDLIKESGIFALSLLDVECSFETIKHFGFQSGRDVDKMKDLTLPVDQNNIPYMGYQACAVISGKVLERQDLGTHTLFIAEVTDAKLLNENAPLTYADYQNRVKPKKKEIPQDKKIVGWTGCSCAGKIFLYFLSGMRIYYSMETCCADWTGYYSGRCLCRRCEKLVDIRIRESYTKNSTTNICKS